MSGLNNKKYLDEVGLATLWARITDYGAPRWTAYKPTTISADATKVVIKHESAATAAQKADSKGVDIAVELPAATQDKAGVMTAADKTKLDNMGSTAEGAVTIKQVQVKNQNLKIDNNKYVDWDFVYNAATDTLDIIDCNDSNKVLTSVSVNSFVGDAILSGVLTDSDIVDKDGENNSGTFIKLTFVLTKNDGTTDSKDIYINVADLIDFYTAGAGITIDNGAINHDETRRDSTITLKIASSTERGGFVAYKVTDTEAVAQTTIAQRYFGVEIGKDDKAIVNVPIGSITKQDNSISGEVTLSPVTGGSTNLITGLNIVENTDKTGHSINLVGTSVKVGKETDVTWSDGTTGTASPKFGETITALTTIESDATGTNGHKIKRTKTTFTLPKPSRKAPADATTATLQTTIADNPAETNALVFTAMTDIVVDGTNGTIQPVLTTYTANVDVLSIGLDTINGLEYPAN